MINIANLHLYSKYVIQVLNEQKESYEKKFIFHCFPLSSSLFMSYTLCFLCCSHVSKWLLYRQRRALCCKMLLRHNWVRLVHSRRVKYFRGRLFGDSASVLARSETGMILSNERTFNEKCIFMWGMAVEGAWGHFFMAEFCTRCRLLG